MEHACYTNDTSVKCRRFRRPAAANSTLVWADVERKRRIAEAEMITSGNPDITVSEFWFADEGEYKDAIISRRALRWKYGPDVMKWWSASSVLLLKDDLMDLRGILQETGLASVLDGDSLEACTGDDGEVYCAPLSFYAWSVIYSRSAFEKIGMLPPSNFSSLIKSCNKFRNAGILPMMLPSKNYWPASAFWDILDMRTNGADFHKNLSLGTVPFTDPRVVRTFENWQRMIDARCFPDDMLESALWDDNFNALWRSNQVAMIYMGETHRTTVMSLVHDEDDIDVMPFPTVTEGVMRGELVPGDAVIVRKTTEQIRPVGLFVSEMLSHKTFEAYFGSESHMSPRTDFTYRQSRWIDRRDNMLNDTDLRLTAFDLLVPPKFFDSFKRALVQWVATSTNPETIPELLHTFEDARQLHLVRRNLPPKITPPSGSYDDEVEVELSLEEHATQPGAIIQYSINQEEVTELYATPIKLLPGESVIRSKVVGSGISESAMVMARFYVIDDAPDSTTLQIILACLLSLLGLCFIIFVVRTGQKSVRLFIERRRRCLAERLASEQCVIDAYKSNMQLKFPMTLIRADRLLALKCLLPFEALSIAENLTLLHSIPEATYFKLSHKIVFLSHQWLGTFLPDPDSLHVSVMKNAVGRAMEMLDMDSDKVYVWIDYISVPQINGQLKDVAIMSLVSYVSLCDVFIIVAPECLHSETNFPCGEATYKSRGWCRGELVARILTNGFGNMYIARSDRDPLETFGEDVDILSLNIFEGDFTCCSRKHDGLLRCDKVLLQNAFLGLCVQLFVSAETGCSSAEFDCQVFREMISMRDTLFPRSFEISSVSDGGEMMTERHSLFGDRLSVCQKLIRLRPEEFSNSVVATVGREPSRALPLVPGTYAILGPVSVYPTPELDEQDHVTLLYRGSTVTVLTVRQARNESTIIGKVDIPPGWIRLSAADLSVRWAALIDEFEDIISC